MLQALACFFCTLLYLVLRPRRVGVFFMDGMRFEYPMSMNAVLIRNFAPLVEWQARMVSGLVAQGVVVEKVTVRDYYMTGTRIGFMLINVSMHLHGIPLPGAVLLRGATAVVLLWYRQWVTGEVHVVLVRQPRVAAGRALWEAPSGTVDSTGRFEGPMLQAVAAYTGTPLDHDTRLCEHRMSPHMSPGLLDETLALYSAEIPPRTPPPVPDDDGGGDGAALAAVAVAAVPLTDARTFEDGKLRVLLAAAKLV